jgi:hypothetical protein
MALIIKPSIKLNQPSLVHAALNPHPATEDDAAAVAAQATVVIDKTSAECAVDCTDGDATVALPPPAQSAVSIVKAAATCEPALVSSQPEENNELSSPKAGVHSIETDMVSASPKAPHNYIHPMLQSDDKATFTTAQLLEYYNPRFNWKLHCPPSDGWVTARCPFHEDEHPSFRLNLKHGGYICHSSACDSGSGDIYKFHMLYEDVTFPVAQKSSR